ncbi:MAG TPA: MogA/MoaB family molybdenum cofactor biosynthesis protein [Chloroflexota bacterium]|nr:MogA/MoaB family molybdenum cofactor biosynthesis protein [Chloroflexota bacterium]
MTLHVGILTVSDRVSAGRMEDRGGAAVEEALGSLDIRVVRRQTVPDDRDQIIATFEEWADRQRLDLIFSTGGTGLGPRDVTPEATLAACDRLVPGMAETMRAAGQSQTPYSMLSRGVVGVRGSTLIINLPGSPRGAAEGVAVLLPVLEHAVAILRGGSHE